MVRQNIIWNIVTDNCIEKMKIQKNGRQWPIKTLKQLLKFLNGKAEADSRRGGDTFSHLLLLKKCTTIENSG